MNEPLVVPMHIPLYGKVFQPFSVLIVAGFIAWMVFAPSLESIALGVFGSASMLMVWGTILTNRRMLRHQPLQIVADDHGLRTPMWSIPWDRIERAWVDGSGWRLRLNIEPTTADSVARPHSFVYTANARLDRLVGHPAIGILQGNVHRPLADLLQEFETRAGRRLTAG